MPNYNTNIDRNRISIEDPDGSYRYLLNEANVDPEVAYNVYTQLQREYAINKPIIDMKNRMFENNPDYKNQLLIKGAIDSGNEIDENLGIDFQNKEAQRILKHRAQIIDEIYNGGNVTFSTSHDKVYKTILSSIKDGNDDLYESIKYGKDKNGDYYIRLDKENSRLTKQFFDFCDTPVVGFDRTKGRYTTFNDKTGSAYGQSGVFGLMRGSNNFSKAGQHNKFRRMYEYFNKSIDRNTDAGDREIYSEMYNMGGQNPYQTSLYAMRDNARTKQELDYYKGLIDANEDKYNTLFQTAPNLIENDIKLYNADKNIYETPTDAEKIELIQSLQEYIKRGKKVSVNTIYDSFNGKFIPEIGFIVDNGKTGDKKVEKQYKFTGDFIHNDSYDEYNKMSQFAAQADVRQMEDIGNEVNIGFYRNPIDNTMSTMQLRYAGAGVNGKLYQIMINNEPLKNGVISFQDASLLRQDYNDLLKVYNELETNKSLTDDYKTAIINKCIEDVSNDYRYIFSSLYGETPIVPSGYESLVRTILNR